MLLTCLHRTDIVPQTLNEYIKDTEDLVNIKLDQHRNQLITTDLILTALTCALAIITTVAGIFGMNLNSGLSVSAAWIPGNFARYGARKQE